MRPYRSVLFVPGHKPSWVGKAVAAGADAIVLDLEDSVPPAEKMHARQTVADSIDRIVQGYPGTEVLVRPNALHTRMTGADLEAVVRPGLAGLFIPKVEGALDLVRYDTLVDHFETRAGVAGLEYIIPVENVPAIWNCREIAAGSSRVGAMIGPTAEHADIAREVGFEWSPEGTETLYLRSRVLLACREAGIHALTGLWERVDDIQGLSAFAEQGRQLGFRGMVAIHPAHVAVINNVFSPSDQQVSFYRGMVEAYERAMAAGDGAIRFQNLHIDQAHYDKARLWLAERGVAQ
jgi:citrate lyase subunit beta/citryl-CoA lyase